MKTKNLQSALIALLTSVILLTGCTTVGGKIQVDALTERLKVDGFEVVDGPRMTGDGYYESCIKIDILDFMNENYMYEFSMEEIAHYTGRSLATFKRDFKKISDLTPERWLIRKRLEVAYAKMKKGGKKVVDVYAEVGFKNPSHFSTAFKKQYGISPTAVFT